MSSSTIDKLQLEATCTGHTGCVNRLAWNSQGTRLASVSDDRMALLWHYPNTRQPPLAVHTGHTSNIFGVAFLPHTNDRLLVTGMVSNTCETCLCSKTFMDFTCCLHQSTRHNLPNHHNRTMIMK